MIKEGSRPAQADDENMRVISVVKTCLVGCGIGFLIACLTGFEFLLPDYKLHPPAAFMDKWVGVITVGQLGNQLWGLASSHGIAKARKARWCIVDMQNYYYGKYKPLLEWKTAPPERCPGWVVAHSLFRYFSFFKVVTDGGYFATYTPVFKESPHIAVMLDGCLQSYKHFDPDIPVPFRLVAAPYAEAWVRWKRVSVAIHVRRWDKRWDMGNVVPPVAYYQQAIRVLNSRFPSSPWQKQDFVVVTDDMGWVENQDVFRGMAVLSSKDPTFDMAVISACQHKIISVGTFGWWGAFLGDTTAGRNNNTTSLVIYPTLQMEWPLSFGFNNSDYFPPHWTGIDPRAYY